MHPAKKSTWDKVKRAVARLEGTNQKLSIKLISETSQIQRKTIYNNPDIKAYCDQVIMAQKEFQMAQKEVSPASLNLTDDKILVNPDTSSLLGVSKSRKALEEKYKKTKDALRKEQLIKQQLLFKLNEYALKNSDLTARIHYLESYIEQLKKDKIIHMNKTN